LKRLRKAYERKHERQGEIRYIIAGEIGSKNSYRVHWHTIIYSDEPLNELGEIRKYDGTETANYETWKQPITDDIWSSPKKRKRRLWTMWPHGIVEIQRCDQYSIEYALKYAMKDMHGEVKSRDTMRWTKSEQHAAGMFRMSKKPPIGMRYLQEKLSVYRDLQAIPPKLEIKVPEYKGYWFPSGKIRETYLQGLNEINNRIRETTGRDAPQWSTLLHSVSGEGELNEKDWEILTYGERVKYHGQTENIAQEIARHQKIAQQRQRGREIRYQCGKPRVCKKCYRGFNEPYRLEFHRWYDQQKQASGSESYDSFERWFSAKKQGNPYCGLKDEPNRNRAFERGYAQRLDEKNVQGKTR
jgi:hypothetical protein